MSLYRKIVDHMRKSNVSSLTTYNSGSSSSSYSSGSSSCGGSQCCANCRHYEEYLTAGANLHYRCRMHGVELNGSDARRKTCNYFQY